MTTPDPYGGVVRVEPFAGLYYRFEEIIASSRRMTLFFIHSRRWRENHDAALKAFLRRPGATLDVFLPDLENRELMYSIGRHFEDGEQIPGLVVDAYRYFARLARDLGAPSEIHLFGRYPTYSFYAFDERAVIAMYTNAVAKKNLPAMEVRMDSAFGRFLAREIEDLRSECRRCAPAELESVIARASAIGAP
ncbi:MAG TPA: hypothetical protein VFZ11_12780 [Gemmatimonadaceae bacterium]